MTDSIQRLVEFLRLEEPRFIDLVSTDRGITLSALSGRKAIVTFLLAEQDLNSAISALESEGAALWPDLSVERRAFNLLAVHMHELIDVPDTDKEFDIDRI